MPNSREIAWGRLIAEGTAIVASILLAFGIDAWWDERQEHREEQQILQDLQEEFVLVQDVLVDHRQWQLDRLERQAALLIALDRDEPVISSQALVTALDDMFAPTTSDISNGTLHALLGSGRLSIITNPELREQLINWEGAIEEVWDDQQAHAKRVYEIHIPFFINEGFGAGELLDLWYGGNSTPLRHISDDPDEKGRLLRDARFRSMLEFNYLYKLHLAAEFDQAIASVAAILDAIEESITP